MIAIDLLFVRILCDCFKSRRRLEAEILILRHQLNLSFPKITSGRKGDGAPTGPLDRPSQQRILAQGQVRAHFIVVRRIRSENSSQVDSPKISMVLPAMHLAAVDHLVDVEPVLEQIGEGATPKRMPPMTRPSAPCRALVLMPRPSRSSMGAPVRPPSR